MSATGVSISQTPPSAITVGANSDVVWSDFMECGRCGLVNVANNDPRRVLAYHDLAIRYREPDDHFEVSIDNVRGYLGKELGAIIGITEKDDALVERFELVARRPSVFRHFDFAAQSWSDPNRLPAGRKLWVCRRFLEHCNDVGVLTELFSNIAVGDFLFIEMLDFHVLQTQPSAMYLWTERVMYPEYQAVRYWLNTQGYQAVWHQEFLGREPFWALLVRKTGQPSDNQAANLSADGRCNPKVTEHFKKFLDEFIGFLPTKVRNSEICFLGTSHKALTLEYFLRELGWKTLLFDQAPRKVGKFHGEKLIQPFFELPSENSSAIAMFKIAGREEIEQLVFSRFEKDKVLDGSWM